MTADKIAPKEPEPKRPRIRARFRPDWKRTDRGLVLGPVRVSKTERNGYSVFVESCGLSVNRSGYRRQDEAKHFAELAMADPGFVEFLESVKPDGDFDYSDDADRLRKFVIAYHPDAAYWKTWNQEPTP